MIKKYEPILRRTFVFVSKISDPKEKIEDHEEYIKYVFFQYEDEKKFKIFFVYPNRKDSFAVIKEINDDEQFVVMFLSEVSTPEIFSLVNDIFTEKNCVIFCQGNHHLREIGVINFTKHDKYFVTTEKLSKPFKTYFHEEEMPERLKRLYKPPS